MLIAWGILASDVIVENHFNQKFAQNSQENEKQQEASPFAGKKFFSFLKHPFGTYELSSFKSLAFFVAIVAVAGVSISLAAEHFTSQSSNPQIQQSSKAVLGAAIEAPLQGTVVFNIPTTFNDDATFTKGLSVSGTTSLNGPVVFKGKKLDLAGGTITASNIIYSLKAGSGVTISGDQTPTITNEGVTSLQGLNGDLALTAGSGISISGLGITNSDPGSAQKIFGSITVGNTTLSAGSNKDTLSFIAGSGVLLTTDATAKSITIASTAGSGNNSPFTTGNGAIYPLDLTQDLLLGGSATSSAAFGLIHVGQGTPTASIGGTLALAGDGSIQTTSFRSLTLGGTTTGNITIAPQNGLGSLSIQTNGQTLNSFTGNGLALTNNALGVNLLSSANGTTGTTSSFSGLEFIGGSKQLGLIQGCADGQLLKWDNTNKYWVCSNDLGGATGVIAVQQGTNAPITGIDTVRFTAGQFTVTSSATTGIIALDPSIAIFNNSNGLAYLSNTTEDFAVGGTSTSSAKFALVNINSGTPTASIGGVLSFDANGNIQTTNNNTLNLGGTSTGNIALRPQNGSGTVTITGGLTATGAVQFSSIATTGIAHLTNTGVLSSSALNLAGGANEITGTLAVGNGGTDIASYASGDLLYANGATSLTKLGIAGSGNVLTSNGSAPVWTSALTGLTGVTSSGTIQFSTLSSNGVLHTTSGNGTLGVAAVALGSEVSGTLPVGNGGLGVAVTPAGAGELLYSTGTTAYGHLAAGTSGYCLTSGGTAAPSWQPCAAAAGVTNYWNLANGTVAPINTTLDLLIGGTATSSANFAFINSATPVASISGNIVLNSTGNIQTTKNQALTLGGSTTGNITLAPQNGSGTVTINGSVTISSISTAGIAHFSNTGVLSSSALNLAGGASEVTGTLGVGNGGTGIASYTSGDLLYSNGATSLTKLGIAGSGNVLVSNGSAPSWTTALTGLTGLTSSGSIQFSNLTTNGVLHTTGGNGTLGVSAVSLTSEVTNTLPVGNGGTGATTLTGILKGNGTGAFTALNGTANYVAYWTDANTIGAEQFLPLSQGGTGANLSTGAQAGGITYYNGTTLALTSAGSAGQCLTGGTTPTWSPCSQSTNWFTQTNGAIYPINTTLDLLIGGTATSSANFAFINSTTPVASVGGTLSFDANGNIQTARDTTLTLGGTTTGNITLLPQNGSGTVGVTGGFSVSGTVNLSGLTASKVVFTDASKNLTTTGTVSVGQGGTGQTSFTTNGVLYGNGTGAVSVTAAGISGQVLIANGSGIPTWGSISGGSGGACSDCLINDPASSQTIAPTGQSTIGLSVKQTSTASPNADIFNVTNSGASTKYVEVDQNGNIIFGGLATQGIAHIAANGQLSSSALNLAGGANEITGTLPVGNGGLGAVVTPAGAGELLYSTGTTAYGHLAAGTSGYCLTSGGTAAPSWQPCAAAAGVTNYWNLANGTIAPINTTLDLLIGGTATSSAKFAFINVNSGVPTASVSAGLAGAAYINAAGTLATTSKQSLTLGDSNTGNIQFFSNANLLTSAGNLTLAGNITAGTYNGNTITSGTGTLTLGAGKTLTANDTTTFGTSTVTLGNGKVLTVSDATTLGTSAVTLGNGKVLTVSDATTLATNAITFGGTENLTLASGKNITFADAFTTSGAFGITLTSTGATNVTLPTTGTLATLAGSESLTNKTINGLTPTSQSDGFTIAGGSTSRTLTVTGADITIGSTIQPTSAGVLSVLSNGANNLTLDSGTTGAVNLGTNNNAKTINIGTGTAGDTINIGTDNTTADTIAIGSAKDSLVLSSAHFSVTSPGAVSGVTTLNLSGAITGPTSSTINGLSINSSTQTLSANNIADAGALTISTGGNGNLTLTAAGTGNTVLSTDANSGVYVGSAANVPAVLSVSGGIGSNASLIVNNLNSGDLFTASASGTTKFTINNNGNILATGTLTGLTGLTSSGSIQFSNLTTNGVLHTTGGNGTLGVSAVSLTSEVTNTLPVGNGGTGATTLTGILKGNGTGAFTALNGTANYVAYWTDANTIGAEQFLPTANGGLGADVTAAGAGELLYSTGTTAYGHLAAGTSGYCLTSGGTAAPSWQPCAAATGFVNYWSQLNGALFSSNTSTDFLVGGSATPSAKFAVLNVNNGTPTASVSAGTNGGAYLTASGTLATTNKQSLTLGDTNTGNIQFFSNANLLTSAGNLTLAGNITAGTYNGNTITNGTGTLTLGSGKTLTANDTTTIGTSTIVLGNGKTLTLSDSTTLGTSAVTLGNGKVLTVSDATTLATNAITFGGTENLTLASGKNITFADAFSTSGAFGITLTSTGATNVTLPTTGTLATLAGSESLTNKTINGLTFAAQSDGFTAAGGTTSRTLTVTGANITIGSTIQPTNAGALTVQSNGANALTLTGGAASTWDINGTLSLNTTHNAAITTGTGLLTVGGQIKVNGLTYTFPGTQTGTQILENDGSGNLSWIDPGTLPSSNFWNQINGVLTPKIDTQDLLIGGQSTASAKFAFINVNSGTPTASISGALSLDANGNIQTTNYKQLTLGGSTTGTIQLSPKGTTGLYIDGNGNVGIGTTIPSALFTVAGGTSLIGANGLTADSANFNDNNNTPIQRFTALGGIEQMGMLNTPYGGIGQYENRLTYSQQFTNGAWTSYCQYPATMTDVTTDIQAPDGTFTANKSVTHSTLGCTNIADGYYQTAPGGLTTGQPYTVSIWMRGLNGNEIVAIGINDNNESSNITLTKTWKRYTYTTNSLSADTTRGLEIRLLTASGTYYLWGAQLEKRNYPGVYIATTGTAVIQSYPYISGLVMNATGSALFAGSVGIGTVAPTAKLEVVGPSTTNDPLVYFHTPGASDNNSISLANGTGIFNFFISGGSNTFMPGTAVGDGGIRVGSSQSLFFGDSSTTRMKINSSGNVGIGTTSINSQLDLGTSVATNKVYLIDNTNDKYGFGANNVGGFGALQIYAGAGASTNFIQFGKYDGTTLTEFARLTGSGLSINTGAAPTAYLDVAGAASVSGSLNFRSGLGSIQTTANNGLTIGGNTTGNINFLPLNGSGSVNVTGGLSVTGSIGSNASLIVNNLNSGDLFTASASGTTKFTINNNGNIQFAGNTSFLNTITSLATAARTYTLPDATGTICVSGQSCALTGTVTSSGTGLAGRLAYFTTDSNITGDTNFYWDSTNQLQGIGTNSPVSKLTLTGAVKGKALAMFNETGDQDLFTASASGTTKFTINNNGNIAATGTLTGLTGLTSSGTINFSGLTASSVVFTDGSKNLTSTGTVGVSNGGLGANLSSGAAVGDLLYATSTTAFSRLADVATGSCLISGGVGVAPSWGQCGGIWNTGSGAIYEGNTTMDLLLGGTATSSADISFTNVLTGTPTMTLGIAGTSNGLIKLNSSGASKTAPTIYSDSSGGLNLTAASGIVTVGNGSGDITLDPGGSNLVANLSGNGSFLVEAAGATFITFDKMSNTTFSYPGTTTTAITVNGSSLTTGGDLALTGASSMTTANLLSLSSDTYVHSSAGETGKVINLAFTDNSTLNAAGTTQTIGLNVLPTFGATGVSGTHELYGAYFQSPTISSPTGTNNLYGIRIGNQGGSGVTNAYGLYIDTPSGATNNYAEIVGGGNSGFGTTTPKSTLDVNGNLAVGSYAGSSAAPSNGLIVSGNVGIGTSGPGFTLDVKGNVSATAAAEINNTNTTANSGGLIVKLGFTGNGTVPTSQTTGNNFVRFLDGNGDSLGSIDSNGGTAISYNSNGLDMAEYFPKKDVSEELVPGDTVCLDVTGGVTKCMIGESILGVVSANPSFVGGGNHAGDPKYVLVGLVGQLPAMVSSAKGDITTGDPLTVASESGNLVKATTPGQIVGHAMQSFNQQGTYGQIMVAVQPSWYDPTFYAGVTSSVLGTSTSATISAQLQNIPLFSADVATISGTLNVLGRTTVTDLGITGDVNDGLITIHGLDGQIDTLAGDLHLQYERLGGIDFLNGLAKIDTSGNMTLQGTLHADTVSANKYVVKGASTGTATLPAGQTSVVVTTNAMTPTAKVYLTPTTLTNKQLILTQKAAGQFTVSITTASIKPITFDWWVVGTE